MHCYSATQKSFSSIFPLDLSCVKKIFKSLDAANDHIATFSPEEIEVMIKNVVLKEKNLQETLREVRYLASLTSLKQLEDHLSGLKSFDSPIDAAISQFSQSASTILKHLDSNQKSFPLQPVCTFMQSLLIALESFLDSLGLLTFFTPAISHQEMEEKNRQMTALMSFISMLSATFIPVFGPVPGGLFVAGVALSLLVTTMTYPLWKPIPLRLPKFEKLSSEHLENLIMPLGKRAEFVDEIAKALLYCQNSHKQLLIVGSPGSGKTSLVKAFANRIYKGVYPEFSDCQMFYSDTASFLENRDWVRPPKTGLEKISEMVQGVSHKTILVFDQMHLLSFFHGKTFLADQLTTMLDSPRAHFPFVLGVVNTFEYGELKEKYPSLIERFSVLKIDTLSDEDLLSGLKQTHLQNSPEYFIEESVFPYILQKSREKWKDPSICNKMIYIVLSEVLALSSKHQKHPMELELSKLEERLENLKLGSFLAPTDVQSRDKFLRQMKDLEGSCLEKKRELADFEKQKMQLFAQREMVFFLKKHLYEVSLEKNLSSAELRKVEFVLLSQILLPCLEKNIHEKAEYLGVNIQVTKALVDQAIKKLEGC